MTIQNKFNIGQTVFLITDPEQMPRMVIALKVEPTSIFYIIASGVQITEHYDIEIYADRNELLRLNVDHEPESTR